MTGDARAQLVFDHPHLARRDGEVMKCRSPFHAADVRPRCVGARLHSVHHPDVLGGATHIRDEGERGVVDAFPHRVGMGEVDVEAQHSQHFAGNTAKGARGCEIEAGTFCAILGPSGAGKSTIANVLLTKFLETGGRPVTLLDGDLVRKNLSSELGFSKEHRDINIRRIGYVASEITKNGGIAICAPIAPYDATRKHVRGLIEPVGGFILVHVSTSVEVCEQRDRKGLYAKARAGILKEFTGISDPYEEPKDAEVVINTADLTPEEAAQEITLHLEREGFFGAIGERA